MKVDRWVSFQHEVSWGSALNYAFLYNPFMPARLGGGFRRVLSLPSPVTTG